MGGNDDKGKVDMMLSVTKPNKGSDGYCMCFLYFVYKPSCYEYIKCDPSNI